MTRQSGSFHKELPVKQARPYSSVNLPSIQGRPSSLRGSQPLPSGQSSLKNQPAYPWRKCPFGRCRRCPRGAGCTSGKRSPIPIRRGGHHFLSPTPLRWKLPPSRKNCPQMQGLRRWRPRPRRGSHHQWSACQCPEQTKLNLSWQDSHPCFRRQRWPGLGKRQPVSTRRPPTPRTSHPFLLLIKQDPGSVRCRLFLCFL